MTQQTHAQDPFAGGGDKTPALSFANAPIGTIYHFTVTEPPEELQTKNFETDEMEFWPDGNKKKAAVLTVTVDEFGGEARSIWARKPSALFRALQEASQTAGVKWGPGVRGSITYIGEKPNEKNPRLNPQKLYSATCQGSDPFAEAPASNATSPQVAPQLPAPTAVPQAAAAALGNLTPEQIAALLAAQQQNAQQPAGTPF